MNVLDAPQDVMICYCDVSPRTKALVMLPLTQQHQCPKCKGLVLVVPGRPR